MLSTRVSLKQHRDPNNGTLDLVDDCEKKPTTQVVAANCSPLVCAALARKGYRIQS
jgi:hypothetical protein